MQDSFVRTALFVPADRPDRFAKALASGADAVIVDFEDAVVDAHKGRARALLREFLDATPGAGVWVRINMAGHSEHASDLELCGHPGVIGVVVPKAQDVKQLAQVAALGKPVWPIIESAQGLAALDALARVPGVERLTFGGLDLSLDLGMTPGTGGAERMLDQARYALLVQSRLAGLQAPLDTVFPDLANEQGLQEFARNAGHMGFAGMLCIHPRQVSSVHAALAPSTADLNWARRVVAGAANDGAFTVDGQMVDAPVIERARRLLAAIAK